MNCRTSICAKYFEGTRIRCVSGLLLLMGFWASSLVEGQSLHWPTDASRLLSSSFCESRPGHFHAGIDIKTRGITGFKVYAVRQGYVWRVRVSPFGYGRALYLKLDTGETIVYAHLAGFVPKIERRVREEQRRQGRFSVDIYFGPDDFLMEKGEVVAYTGQSGAGAPHLHFEIRDNNNCPVNPHLFGLSVSDHQAPIIRRLSVTPLDMHSSVSDDVRPSVAKIAQVGRGSYMLTDTVRVFGRIGLAVSCFDRADGAPNTYSPYRLRSYVDGKSTFAVTYDRFCYRETRQIDLDRDYRLAARGYGIFYKLYKETFNSLGFYNYNSQTAGVLLCGIVPEAGKPSLARQGYDSLLSPGLHQLRIEVADYWGNTSTLTGYLSVPAVSPIDSGHVEADVPLPVSFMSESVAVDSALERPRLASGTWCGDSSAATEYSEAAPFSGTGIAEQVLEADDMTGFVMDLEADFYDDYVRFEIRSERPLPGLPVLTMWAHGRQSQHLGVHRIDSSTFYSVLGLSSDLAKPYVVEVFGLDERSRGGFSAATFNLFPISAHGGGEIVSEDGQCRVEFEGGAVYQTLYGRISTIGADRDDGCPIVGQTYSLQPTDVSLRGRSRLYMGYPEDESQPEKLAVFSRNKSGDWSFAGNRLDRSARTVNASITSLGEFAVLHDTVPPVIFRLLPEDGDTVATRQPELRVEFEDGLSGIGGEESVVLKLDGRRLISEYDPPRRAAFYTPTVRLSPGRHTVAAEIADRCGNRSFVEQKFYVR